MRVFYRNIVKIHAISFRGSAPKTPRKGILLIYAVLNVKTIIL